MTWDLRSRYVFDASESQIAEGRASPYGFSNASANCIPASFTAALDLAGYGDIDPQRVTNELYGPDYRGGYGTFDRMLQWIAANVPSAPSWTHTMSFDFAVADRAGEAGQLIVIAGWIDPASVTFIGGPASWSHASLLVAHQADDSFVIWNTWTGQFQTYSRQLLAASLYEMAIMTGDDMNTEQDQTLHAIQSIAHRIEVKLDAVNAVTLARLEQELLAIPKGDFAAGLATIAAAVKALPTSATSVDTKPILDAIQTAQQSLDQMKAKIDKDLA